MNEWEATRQQRKDTRAFRQLAAFLQFPTPQKVRGSGIRTLVCQSNGN